MKLNINETLELTDAQRTINGEMLLGKELRPLFGRALQDLAEGKTVFLAQYDLDEKLRAILSTPEARERARAILEIDRPTFVAHQPLDAGMAAFATEVAAAGNMPGPPAFGPAVPELAAAEPNDDTAEFPAPKICKRCKRPMDEEEVGLCEGCTEPLCMDCRAVWVQAVIAGKGPLPRELRGGLAEDGTKIPMPYFCGDCLVKRLPAEED